MARKAKPWYWKARKCWYVTIRGRRYRLSSNKKEAEKLFHETMAKPAETIRSDSVIVICDLFLDWTKKYRKPRTYEFYLERLQEFVGTIPDMSIHQLKPYHVQEWIDTKKSDGHKRGCITAVTRAFNWAKKMGYVDANPIAGMEKPPAGKREVIISAKEFKKILCLTHDQQFHDILTFCWETGCRPQEAMNLEARHLELKGHRAVYPPDEAKIKTRPRIIYLTDDSEEIVKRLAKRFPQGRLFRNAKGEPWHRNNINCRFQRMKKHIGKKLCLYNLRHSFATRLLEAGVDALTVAILLGHSDVSMLGKVYQHLAHNPRNLRDQLMRA